MKQENDPLPTLCHELSSTKKLLKATLSSPKDKTLPKSITVRPVAIQSCVKYQVTKREGNKAIHVNLEPAALGDWLLEQIQGNYRQALLITEEKRYQILVDKKGKPTIIAQKQPSALPIARHNETKKYILPEGKPVPFLIETGIMRENGTVPRPKYNKFKQINRYLEFVKDLLPSLPAGRTLRIIDFGCGKAYLTFALHYYLVTLLGYHVEIVGLDLKQDVIEHCHSLVQSLGLEGLHFQLGDINHYEAVDKVDLVVSLHACDTATDAAIEKAVRWDASAILCVPCCQHELFKQVHNQDLKPLLKHGILRERAAALITDAARAQILEILGYHTQVLEFIDTEHTPKNLLIRAVKRQSKKDVTKEKSEYLSFRSTLGITPSLEVRFRKEMGL